MSNDYEISKRNKVRQLREKANYDRDTVHKILDSALIASVGFVEDGQPVVVPMLFGREGETLYLHGARKARVIRLLESTTTACLNVTHVDGLVYARSAFNSSMNYRSATVYGTPRLVEGTDDKLHALKVISESTMPGRWGEVRDSHINEIKKTGVIALDIESASAKLANGMPKDEEEDYAIPIWAGVLPLVSAFTHLQPDQRLLDGVEPSAVVKAMQGKVL
ncbi:MAG: pyridoxamine 5'-phosphate oxidase family protein [Gammaproteobacteria bacterium]|nr:pyridoxamine 5'-phosphate oxidase family protein [Gammaproteobacteria bacterium]MDH5240340.1 pyridoxamine 5'-phosphate oxidase family protein [Gammaproteobacteria bacterium]MDH5262369.1 pyridoxamine 5'-phosphate oxidase family protein [Gammaproteobacteria bacterium]MDH5582672.1 pyridoxamine 5'-phosphate oxidase family protein [Gammaproteobacteria bacterium]